MQLSYSDYQEYYHDIFDDIYNDAQGYKSLSLEITRSDKFDISAKSF